MKPEGLRLAALKDAFPMCATEYTEYGDQTISCDVSYDLARAIFTVTITAWESSTGDVDFETVHHFRAETIPGLQEVRGALPFP